MIGKSRFIVIGLIVSVVFAFLSSAQAPAQAQPVVAPCGLVEGFEFPVPDVNTQHTDFGRYREKFGGLHTAIDVAFHRTGDPVHAAARGQVTYSDTEGWDTEKGVVVIQHTFADGPKVNTLYGHMEELNGYTFPPMGACVEQGDIIGAVGDPSLSAPHLHYEVRTRFRREGGPGYTDTNPLELGWLDPVDFTFVARLWSQPAHLNHFSLSGPPTLPPTLLPDGTYLVALDNHLICMTGSGVIRWQFDTLTTITGLIPLPDGRILVATVEGQIYLFAGGNFAGLWQLPQPTRGAPLLWNNRIIFRTHSGSVAAFTPDGTAIWTSEPTGEYLQMWAASVGHLAGVTQHDRFIIVDDSGQMVYEEADTAVVQVFAARRGGFFVAEEQWISHMTPDGTRRPIVELPQTFTSNAVLLEDEQGNLFVYAGEGRALYAYAASGTLRWIAYMPGDHSHAPRLAIGGGTRIYVLTNDSQLMVFDTKNGQLLAHTAIYDGGIKGVASARWLAVDDNDRVRMSGGYLSVVELDGLLLHSTLP